MKIINFVFAFLIMAVVGLLVSSVGAQKSGIELFNLGENSGALLPFEDETDIEIAQNPLIIPSPHLVCFAASNTVYFACMDEYGPYHVASCFEQGVMKRCQCYRSYGIDVGGCYNA